MNNENLLRLYVCHLASVHRFVAAETPEEAIAMALRSLRGETIELCDIKADEITLDRKRVLDYVVKDRNRTKRRR